MLPYQTTNQLGVCGEGLFSHVICFHPAGPLGFDKTLPKAHLFLRS